MPIPLGVLAVAGAGAAGAAAAYELIETQILSGTATSVTFSNLNTYNTTYQHLQIRAVARTTGGQQVDVRINGSTADEYNAHRLVAEVTGGVIGLAASYSGSATAMTRLVTAARSQTPTNGFGAIIIDILDAFEGTKNPVLRAFSGFNDRPSNDDVLIFASGMRRNTAAVTSITLLSPSASFVANSRFSIYGLRSA